MTVAELIAALQGLPADAEVWLHWDGSSRTSADFAWLARGGHVSIGDCSQPIYNDADRVEGAPIRADDPYLEVAAMLGYEYDIIEDPDTYEDKIVLRKRSNPADTPTA